VIHQVHVSGLSAWATSALSAGLWIPLAFRLAAFASWTFVSPLGNWASLPKIAWLTELAPGPQRDCRVPHQWDTIGVGAACTPGPWCPRSNQFGGRVHFGPLIALPTILSATLRYGASSAVYLRSPVRSSPCPVRPYGSGLPWASPLCCRTLRYLALAGVRDRIGHYPEPWQRVTSTQAGSEPRRDL